MNECLELRQIDPQTGQGEREIGGGEATREIDGSGPLAECLVGLLAEALLDEHLPELVETGTRAEPHAVNDKNRCRAVPHAHDQEGDEKRYHAEVRSHAWPLETSREDLEQGVEQ